MSQLTSEGTARNSGIRRARFRLIAAGLCIVVAVGAIVGYRVTHSGPTFPIKPKQYIQYLGVHESDAPGSYAQIDQFAHLVGRQPNLVTYYSPWLEQFQASFAAQALQHGALTVVQIDPQNVQLKDIVAGSYDSYLRSYALAIRAFGARIVVSFGHEMNGDWSSWGYTQTSATVFVAAWRHIVNVFRSAGANNVTWLWTVNVVDSQNSIPNPSPWWPGKSYVNMVGIDGYFYLPSQTFADLFGPTIVDVRALTAAPILVAETGATNAAGQPAKINELFGGIRSYGLSGFVWFDENTEGRAWRIDSPAAFAALRQNVREYMRPPTVAGATTEPSASSSP